MTGESVLSAGLVKVGLTGLVAQDPAERSIFAPGYSANAARCWHNGLGTCGGSARTTAFGIPEVDTPSCRVSEGEPELGHVVLAAAARSLTRARNAVRSCSWATICPRSSPRRMTWSGSPPKVLNEVREPMEPRLARHCRSRPPLWRSGTYRIDHIESTTHSDCRWVEEQRLSREERCFANTIDCPLTNAVRRGALAAGWRRLLCCVQES
jgi:hypothetical protein